MSAGKRARPPASVILASAELAALDLKKAPDSSSSFGRVVLLAGPELHFRHKRRTPIPGRIKDLVQVPVGGPRSGSAWQALGLWSGRGRMWVLESGAFPGP